MDRSIKVCRINTEPAMFVTADQQLFDGMQKRPRGSLGVFSRQLERHGKSEGFGEQATRICITNAGEPRLDEPARPTIRDFGQNSFVAGLFGARQSGSEPRIESSSLWIDARRRRCQHCSHARIVARFQ